MLSIAEGTDMLNESIVDRNLFQLDYFAGGITSE